MSLQRLQPHPVSSVYRCEVCGQEVSDVDVVSYGLILRQPGKNPTIPAFQCSAEQHFGCCEEHAWQAMVACHNDHLLPAYQALHQAAEQNESLMTTVQHLRETQHLRAAWIARSLSAPDAPTRDSPASTLPPAPSDADSQSGPQSATTAASQ